jgi:hypothetical protein
MIQIDFLVPGFSKCGTTTLCALLDQHPGLFIPGIKEPWFFSAYHFEERKEEYCQFFAPANEGQLLGEGSVSYSGYKTEKISIERIRENNPDCRFIFIARNPVKRIESSYREMHHSGVKFALNAPYVLSDNFEMFPQMIQDSRYFERIGKYLDAFGEESLIVLFLEDLRDNAQAELGRCFRHLGLDDSFEVDAGIQLNAGETKLYDTKLLRYFRTRAWSGFRLARYPQEVQDKWLQPLGLRRPFRRPISWDARARSVVEEQVFPDARSFLEKFGKSTDFWDLSFPG